MDLPPDSQLLDQRTISLLSIYTVFPSDNGTSSHSQRDIHRLIRGCWPRRYRPSDLGASMLKHWLRSLPNREHIGSETWNMD